MSAALALLGPAVLWAIHFLVVYIFVSLACLWRWQDATLLGLPLIEAVVALLTLAFIAAIVACGWIWGWSDGFRGRVGIGMTALFAVATAMVGLPTLLTAACVGLPVQIGGG
jgi:ABC-type amino acid transport system permease subunit